MDDVRIHRSDCKGFDENIDCVGCFKAQMVELLSACHDHMVMDPTGRGGASRSFKKIKEFLEANNGNHN